MDLDCWECIAELIKFFMCYFCHFHNTLMEMTQMIELTLCMLGSFACLNIIVC